MANEPAPATGDRCDRCGATRETHYDSAHGFFSSAELHRQLNALLARALSAEQERDDEREKWQDATGLVAGGDPGGVTPALLSSIMGRFYDLEDAARRLPYQPCFARFDAAANEPCGKCPACRFTAALAALPKED